jgi:WD40 repeat protein
LTFQKKLEISFRLEFTCHSQCIFAIAWISDRLLCATSGDQTTVIYDIETGAEIDLLRGHTMSVRSVCKLYSSTRKFSEINGDFR